MLGFFFDVAENRAEPRQPKSFSKMSQIVTKVINGIEISFKVSDDNKHVWILLDDNFALAEGYFTMRAMLAGFLYKREEHPEIRTEKNNWSEVDTEGFFSIEFAKQSKVLKEIVNEIRNN